MSIGDTAPLSYTTIKDIVDPSASSGSMRELSSSTARRAGVATMKHGAHSHALMCRARAVLRLAALLPANRDGHHTLPPPRGRPRYEIESPMLHAEESTLACALIPLEFRLVHQRSFGRQVPSLVDDVPPHAAPAGPSARPGGWGRAAQSSTFADHPRLRPGRARAAEG